ncbi:MAG: hypothetical protein V3V14_11225 [Saprospiraceae bacterium]
MTGTNKYNRNFLQATGLKRAGRIDLRLFQYASNVGDGYGGLLYMIYKLIGGLFHGFVIEGCEYNGSDTISAGYVLHNGAVVQVASQNKTLNNDEWLYVGSDGIAVVTGTEATALENVAIYMKDTGGTGFDIRFKMTDNMFQMYELILRDNLTVNGIVDFDKTLNVDGNATFQSEVDINGQTNLDEVDIDNTNPVDISGGLTVHGTIIVDTNLNVDGIANLDNTDIDGTLDVSGTVDFHSDLDMNNTDLKNIKAIDGNGDAIIFNDDIDLNQNDMTNIVNLYGYSTNSIVLQSNLNVNAKNLENINDLDVNGNADIEGTVDINDVLTVHSGIVMSTSNISGVKEIIFTEDPSVDHTVSAITSLVQIDFATVAFGDVLIMSSDGHYDGAKADAEGTLPALVMSLETSSGSNKKVLHSGYVRDNTWAWTPGDLIYVDPNTVGKITSTKPTTAGDFIQVLGYAVTADIMHFNPEKLYAELL